MPKESASVSTKLNKLLREFGKDIFSTDGSVLFCKFCETKVNFEKKYFVTQHLSTAKHKMSANKSVDPKKTCLLQNFKGISQGQSQFSLDLCKALLDANIPLWKLENSSLKEFLQKYTKEQIPNESTLRKNYVDIVYLSVIENIREKVKEKQIWVSIDETTDALGRYVANVIIGTMDHSERCEVFLLHTEQLEAVNNTSIVQLFTNSLSILWPTGMKYKNVCCS